MKKDNKRDYLIFISAVMAMIVAVKGGIAIAAETGGIQMGRTIPTLKDVVCVAMSVLIGIILGFVLRKLCQERYTLISTILIGLGFIVVIILNDPPDLEIMFCCVAVPLFYNYLIE